MRRLIRAVQLALLGAAATPEGADAQTYEVFHSFQYPGTGPASPYAALVIGPDGNFYGTTRIGGGSLECGGGGDGCGTVFRMTPSGTVTTLHAFSRIPDGAFPQGSVHIASTGDLYGTTTLGGSEACNCGTVWRIDSNGIFTTVHTFEGPDGRTPESALIEPVQGDLWGTTAFGGAGTCTVTPDGCGTIFRMHLNGDLETMHDMDDDTYLASQGLLLASDGNMYGSSVTGGADGIGLVYRITLNGNFTTVHEFDLQNGDGVGPGQLIQAADGNLAGTTVLGSGTIFRVALDGGGFDTLHEFPDDAHEGTTPFGTVLQADDGLFYGANLFGGVSLPYGTVFQIDDAGNLVVIHDFELSDGAAPHSEPIQGLDGRLYGTAAGGGPLGGGVVYRITMPGSLRFFCPDAFVRRDQMAVFLLKMVHGADHVPPACAGVFGDVACPGPFADWIEELAAEGVTAGCGGGDYCPLSPITRAQMAVFLLKSEHGPAYAPPACAGVFLDVPCPSTFAPWIEQLAAEGVTAGCGGGNFCPDSPVTRAQMAVFLLKVAHGGAFVPPGCFGRFADVPCPSGFAGWIEELYLEGITAGCSGPAAPERATRAAKARRHRASRTPATCSFEEAPDELDLLWPGPGCDGPRPREGAATLVKTFHFQ